MQKNSATRYSPDKHHASYGLYNWFKNKGISNQDIMKEAMANFCIKNGISINCDTKEIVMISFCQLKFQSFASFAIIFLNENNYLQKKVVQF